MKTYIIFTPEITNMGGAQMYTANKAEFLKSKGWNVQVCFPKRKGEVKIPALKDFEGNYMPDFCIPLQYMSHAIVSKLCQRIGALCAGSDEVVLESQIITQSFLVEKIAEHIGARHIINTLDERIPVYFKRQNDFFAYKLSRWEFQNSSERRLMRIFGDDFNTEMLKYQNNMVYKCSNVVDENGEQYEFSTADFSILSIGRLDKPYILPMTEEIVFFVNRHTDKTFNVIYVGGSFSGEEEIKIQDIFSSVTNVSVYMMGYTFPVSKSILSEVDVAIASANSVNVTADQDIPTIVADIYDSMAIGVYGYNTTNKFARVSEPAVAIHQYLENVLIDGLYPPKGTLTDTMSDANDAFERELTFIGKSHGNVGYYNVDDFITFKMKLKGILYRFKQLIVKF